MIALLALCPVRLKNFSGLTLGKNFVNLDGSWWIVLRADETKERNPDERSIPKFLASSIDHYISTYRPVFKYLGQQLWAGSEGQPLGYSGVAVVITETTRQTLGIPISPHLFRSCAASTATKHGSKTPNLGNAILNHRDPTIVEKHYNRSRSSYYAREFGNTIEKLT